MGNRPLDFDSFVDVDLSWDLVAEKTAFPQTANILILVKSEGNGNVVWHSFFTTIIRSDYDKLSKKELEITNIDVHVDSLDFVGSVKEFINRKQMIPFSWVSNVVFTSATSLDIFMGSTAEFEETPPVINIVIPPGNKIEDIGTDFTMVFPKTTNIYSPITLNLNPSFTCGNDVHEADLGERSSNCCYDAGCDVGEYCDVNGLIESGECKSLDSISMTVSPVTVETVQDCSDPITITLRPQINGVSNPESTLNGIAKLQGIEYSVTCNLKGSSQYECLVNFVPTTTCGEGTYVIGSGNNELRLTVSFTDGASLVSKDVTANINDIEVDYECGCDAGQYCDAVLRSCRTDSISLGIPVVENSFLEDFASNKIIKLSFPINNPPSGMTLQPVVYEFGDIIFAGGSFDGPAGNVVCSDPENDYTYECSIPISIESYNSKTRYEIKRNNLTVTVQYRDGSVARDKTLTTASFADIIIPAAECGNNQIEDGETSDTCCQDVGCSVTGQYCDAYGSCKLDNQVSLSLVDVDLTTFSDCDVEHFATITTRVNNPPSDLVITNPEHDSDHGRWTIDCAQPTYNGEFLCDLTIPVLPACSLDYEEIKDNTLNVTLLYSNNSLSERQIAKELSLSFNDLKVIPTYTCGDGVCETNLGEGAHCCRDCGCSNIDQYCDFDPNYDTNGTCQIITDTQLVIENINRNLKNCEVDNEVNIRARILNPPSGIRIENVFAEINGSNAERVSCQQEAVEGLGNFSLVCKLRIPRLFACTAAGGINTYEYNPNTLYARIAFNNGTNKRITQTLPADLGKITVSQEFKSIYDIMEDSKSRLTDKFDGLKRIVQEALDETKWCIDRLKASLYITLGATLVGAFIGGLSGGLSGIIQGAQAGALIGGIYQQSLEAYCNALQTFTEISLKTKDIEIKEIQMDTCIATYQHDIDSDRCRGQEVSCFEKIKSCLNTINDMKSDLDSIQQDFKEVNTEFRE
ncbi:MAG: hypothetical protein KKC05_02765, partial [Nanoarchaeota archaeon]|nr:hypothetical protein [Nanoarchaeota archaeon]